MVAGLNLAPISSTSGRAQTRPVILAASRLSQDGMLLLAIFSPTILKYSVLLPLGVRLTTSPTFRTCDGMADFRPFTVEMTVQDYLPGLRARVGEAQTVTDVVQAQLQRAQEVLTGNAVAPHGFLVVLAELALQDAVDQHGRAASRAAGGRGRRPCAGASSADRGGRAAFRTGTWA